ncbi:TRAP transporter small permease subunit [Rhodobacteraceae bacterium F11138]|nr:TRAP transporter small permease subunit [Rhodobacteraceae bacterium F11138]
MRQVAKLARGVVTLCAVLGVLAYGAAALVTVADILGRRVGLPIEGVVDLVQLFVVTGAWLVMPFAFLTAAHVGVDLMIGILPQPLKVLLKIAGGVLTLGLLGLMLQQGYATFLTRTMFGDTSQQLGIPIAWYWYPLLIGMALSILAVLLELTDAQRGGAHHE